MITHGAKTKPVIRYDYFETQVTIGGKEFTVSFDVEVYRDKNNYRTHKVLDDLELTESKQAQKEGLPPLSAAAAAYPNAVASPELTASGRGSSPDVNIAQRGADVKGDAFFLPFLQP